MYYSPSLGYSQMRQPSFFPLPFNFFPNVPGFSHFKLVHYPLSIPHPIAITKVRVTVASSIHLLTPNSPDSIYSLFPFRTAQTIHQTRPTTITSIIVNPNHIFFTSLLI